MGHACLTSGAAASPGSSGARGKCLKTQGIGCLAGALHGDSGTFDPDKGRGGPGGMRWKLSR